MIDDCAIQKQLETYLGSKKEEDFALLYEMCMPVIRGEALKYTLRSNHSFEEVFSDFNEAFWEATKYNGPYAYDGRSTFLQRVHAYFEMHRLQLTRGSRRMGRLPLCTLDEQVGHTEKGYDACIEIQKLKQLVETSEKMKKNQDIVFKLAQGIQPKDIYGEEDYKSKSATYRQRIRRLRQELRKQYDEAEKKDREMGK